MNDTLFKLVKLLINILNNSIFVGYRRIKVLPYTLLTQCFRCLNYGHTTKTCNSNQQICGYCSETHDYKHCPNKNDQTKVSCFCCKKYFRGNSYEFINHNVLSSDCPYRTIIRQRMNDRTDYGYVEE